MEQKKSGGFRSLVRLIALLAAIVCLAYILWWVWRSRQQQLQRQDTASQYIQDTATTAAIEDTTTQAEGTSPSTDMNHASVDFPALQAVSSDVIGWLRVAGLDDLDDPVVFRDDEFYLTHSWDGTYSQYGAIFLEEANNPDFSDYHTILYGHNMRDGAMFGQLDAYADPDFYEEQGGLITLITPEGTRVYQIFATEYVDAADPIVYTVGFSPGETYTEFLQGLVDRALYDTGVELRSSDRVLTLSTCSYENRARFVVHARELQE